jgi:hypothetical protein
MDFALAMTAEKGETGDIHRQCEERHADHYVGLRCAAYKPPASDLENCYRRKYELHVACESRGAKFSLRRRTDGQQRQEIDRCVRAHIEAVGNKAHGLSSPTHQHFERKHPAIQSQQDLEFASTNRVGLSQEIGAQANGERSATVLHNNRGLRAQRVGRPFAAPSAATGVRRLTLTIMPSAPDSLQLPSLLRRT